MTGNINDNSGSAFNHVVELSGQKSIYTRILKTYAVQHATRRLSYTHTLIAISRKKSQSFGGKSTKLTKIHILCQFTAESAGTGSENDRVFK